MIPLSRHGAHSLSKKRLELLAAHRGAKCRRGHALHTLAPLERSSLTPSLGDSGFSVIRRDDSAFHSSPQTHYFNCPLQLSKIPPRLRGQGVIMDKPEMGEKFEVKMGNGDVMILYVSATSRRAQPTSPGGEAARAFRIPSACSFGVLVSLRSKVARSRFARPLLSADASPTASPTTSRWSTCSS